MSGFFPHAALGYRCNPFRALTDEEWEEICVLPAAIREALTDRTSHLQVLGEAGRGKSTVLRGAFALLRDSGLRARYEYLPEGERRFRTDPRGLDVFLLDEAQRLTFWERRRLFKAAAMGVRLVLGSHEDFSPLFKRRRLPLRSFSLDASDEAHFRAVVRKRLARFRSDSPEAAELTEETLGRLWQAFGADLRGAEAVLYDLFQDTDHVTAISIAEVERRLSGR